MIVFRKFAFTSKPRAVEMQDAELDALKAQRDALLTTMEGIWRIAAGESDFDNFQKTIRRMAVDAINAANGVESGANHD